MFLSSALAVVLSIATTSALASAMSYEGDDDDAEMKTAACAVIGCHNGARVCGTAGGTIKVGIPPFVGEVNVTYTCYEAAPMY